MKITIPKQVLRLPVGMMSPAEGRESETVMPEVNDPVSFTVEGVVTAVTGDNAEVEVRFVNGERPVTTVAKETKAGEPSDDDLLAMAEKADAEVA